MSVSNAKAHLDQGGGEPASGYITPDDVKASYDDLESAWQADIAASRSIGDVPTGGTTGQLLAKSSASDYALTWTSVAVTEYGDHLVNWNGSAWRYQGATITQRPSVAAFADGGRVIWNTSLHSAVTTPPTLAIAGDVWIPHGSVDPT